MSWTEEVVAELVRLRKARVRHFEVAWSYAMAEYPPSGMVLGPRRRSLLDDEECLHDFLKRRCQAEWEGKAVEDFSSGLRALMESGYEEVAVVRRAVHSHKPSGSRAVA